jgi:hypothetical protein
MPLSGIRTHDPSVRPSEDNDENLYGWQIVAVLKKICCFKLGSFLMFQNINILMMHKFM